MTQEFSERQDQEGEILIGICDFVAVPTPVRKAFASAMMNAPDRVSFPLYTHALAWASMNFALAESHIESHELVASPRAVESAVCALLVALYTLSKCSPHIFFKMEAGSYLFAARDGILTVEPISPRSLDLPTCDPTHVTC